MPISTAINIVTGRDALMVTAQVKICVECVGKNMNLDVVCCDHFIEIQDETQFKLF